MIADLSILNDVEGAIGNGSAHRRIALLRHITDLFVVGSDRFSEGERTLFDSVFNRLIADIETSARSLLAQRLAPIRNAPPKTIRALAFDDEVDVACPVLTQSEQLDDLSLVENARTKGQDHLFAISRRRVLGEAVTDVLVERGDAQVVLSAVENRGARFSSGGFIIIVRRSAGDDRLTASTGARAELPQELFLELLSKASDHVRAKLRAERPHAVHEIDSAIDEVTSRIENDVWADRTRNDRDFGVIEAGRRPGQFDKTNLLTLAERGQTEDVIMGLAILCDLSPLFVGKAITSFDTAITLARAVELPWATIKAILQLTPKLRVSASELAQWLARFERLDRTTAQNILNFHRARDRAGR